ncbi:MAG TPA: hypothetical protein VLH81_10860, partial [Desulfobacterales bacterium]|nr:hypothetical protein [Desulfobacterales bacterium]
MISTERMRKIEVLVLSRDVDEVLRHLGFAGCLQLITEAGPPRELTPDERALVELNLKITSLCRFVGVDAAARGTTPPSPTVREELARSAQALIDAAQELVNEEARLLQLKLNLRQTVDELSAFAHLRVAFSELEHLTYLAFRLGTVPLEKVAPLAESLEKRALVIPLGRPGYLMAITPKKGR